mmetsp:Transcript_76620/g.216672  ORF Transcript_76620/g.216672 Transcript_76620/m.216672 type:complete len:343 (-) Transcript_76620:431-1459(-)
MFSRRKWCSISFVSQSSLSPCCLIVSWNDSICGFQKSGRALCCTSPSSIRRRWAISSIFVLVVWSTTSVAFCPTSTLSAAAAAAVARWTSVWSLDAWASTCPMRLSSSSALRCSRTRRRSTRVDWPSVASSRARCIRASRLCQLVSRSRAKAIMWCSRSRTSSRTARLSSSPRRSMSSCVLQCFACRARSRLATVCWSLSSSDSSFVRRCWWRNSPLVRSSIRTSRRFNMSWWLFQCSAFRLVSELRLCCTAWTVRWSSACSCPRVVFSLWISTRACSTCFPSWWSAMSRVENSVFSSCSTFSTFMSRSRQVASRSEVSCEILALSVCCRAASSSAFCWRLA